MQENLQKAKDREKSRWKFDSTKVDFKKLEKIKPPSIKFKVSSSPNNNESVQYSDFDMPDIRSENSRMVIPDERYSDGGYPSERTIEYSEFINSDEEQSKKEYDPVLTFGGMKFVPFYEYSFFYKCKDMATKIEVNLYEEYCLLIR